MELCNEFGADVALSLLQRKHPFKVSLVWISTASSRKLIWRELNIDADLG
jgi:hypothetical protein